jgi:chemotaxis methyl-accepting protein methylase
VWSAGCSDGAELYSVAMLLSESGGAGDDRGIGIELLGTDCRPNAVAAAAEGVYDPAAVAGRAAGTCSDVISTSTAPRYRVNGALRAAAPVESGRRGPRRGRAAGAFRPGPVAATS